MNSTIKIRGYEEGDEIQLVELIKLVFDTRGRTDPKYTFSDHFNWKYLENPNGIVCIAIAEDNGKIIGCNNVIVRQVKINDTVYLQGDGGDAAVHPNYRNQGIYNKLRKQTDLMEQILNIDYHEGVTTNRILMNRNIRHAVDLTPRARGQII